jgi:hypothetical protein
MKKPLIALGVLGVACLIPVGLVSASEQGTASAGCSVPADVLDLSNWYEGLPIGDDGEPANVEQPQLAGYSVDPWFTTTPGCDGVQFRAPVDGVTTSGSSYPRSELREMSGSDKASWSSTSGTHTMVIDEAITHLPNDKPAVVAGQIHGEDDDISVFRLEGTKLYVTNEDDSNYQLITSDYQLGTEFEAKFVVSDGQVKAYYNGQLAATIDADFDGAYFKAGAYTQANCDKSSPCSDDNYGEVVITKLAVSHSDATSDARGDTDSGAPRAADGAWPGDAAVTEADESDVFGKNLSGLSFGGPDLLWAVKNGPGTLYRLQQDGDVWAPDGDGQSLHYPGGDGDPDAEGVVATADGVFAATERDNDNKDDSLQEILRFDPSSSSDSLDATGEWNLTSDLPESDANTGIEGIAWVPDSYLVGHGFHDQNTGATYDPSAYPNHGDGLYLVGLESDGGVYAYALDLTGTGYTRVATVRTGLPAVMDLEFDPAAEHLWAECDDTCDGQSQVLGIDGQGAFAVAATYDRPGEMPNYNNEGFAIAPQCADGRRTVFWSDDDNDDDHALRSGTLSCTNE